MAMKITRDILESYLQCEYKAHLKLAKQQGTKGDYELLLLESSPIVYQGSGLYFCCFAMMEQFRGPHTAINE